MGAVESPKICTLIGSFCRKHIKFYLKKQFSIMTLMSDAKFEEKPALGCKNDITNLVILIRAVENLKFWFLMYYFCQWHIKFYLKKCSRVISHDNEDDPNFEEKITFCLKNGMNNLVKFNSSSGKSENLHFDGIFLPKVCNVSAKKIETSCVVKNDLWFQK